MIDLHCHILPGVDDGARDLATSLEMARMFVDHGVEVVACTPHILPGVYQNSGPQILNAVERLQAQIADAGLPLKLVAGADNHIIPDFVEQLRKGHLLSLAGSRYVLVEPPHHVAPARLDELFFAILLAGHVPILTHPERLSWIESKYDLVVKLWERGVWMQITAGSLRGKFGSRARYWADRMLCEGRVHLLATDAHGSSGRRPDLLEGARAAEALIGARAAQLMVALRPAGIVQDIGPSELQMGDPDGGSDAHGGSSDDNAPDTRARSGFFGRLRNVFSS